MVVDITIGLLIIGGALWAGYAIAGGLGMMVALVIVILVAVLMCLVIGLIFVSVSLMDRLNK